ncbi:MAG: hypothetical protein ACRDQZ_07750 [Mycobacteriales bacterium]
MKGKQKRKARMPTGRLEKLPGGEIAFIADSRKQTIPTCEVHHKKLVCPSCAAIARGRKGGIKRAKSLTKDQLHEIGKLGGRPRNEVVPERPQNVLTPR